MSELNTRALNPVNLNQAKQIVKHLMMRRLVPLLLSKPGLGKSSIMQQIAQEMNLCFIDVRASQLMPEDMNGFPAIVDGVATYVTFDTFPTEDTPLPINASTGQPYSGWLIMLDELPSANEQVFASMYKLILDRMVGQRNLHESCFVVSAGNRMQDNAIVNDMGTALKSRIVEITVSEDFDESINYFMNNNFDPRILAYLYAFKKDLNSFDPEQTEYTYACSRTWEMLHKALSTKVEMEDIDLVTGAPTGKTSIRTVADRSLSMDENYVQAMIKGIIGPEVGQKFIAFCKVADKIPTYKDIVSNPLGTVVPSSLDLKYATAISIVDAIKDEGNDIKNVVEYIKRIPQTEIHIVFFRMISQRQPSLYRNEHIRDLARNAIKSGEQ